MSEPSLASLTSKLRVCPKHGNPFYQTCPFCTIEEFGSPSKPTPKPTPEFEERERRLARLLEDMPSEQLIMFALWEIHAATADTSDVVSAELLRRSGIPEEIGKW